MPYRRLNGETTIQPPVKLEQPFNKAQDGITQEPQPQQQGWPSYLGGEASRVGAKGLSALLGFPADIAHAFLGPQQEMQERLREKVPAEGIVTPLGKLTPEKYEGPVPLSSEFYFDKIYKPLVAKGMPENYARAQSKLGEVLDTTAENLVMGSLLGGGTLKKLGLGAVGGALGKQTAKELKLGPTGQAVGGLIGGIAAQSIPDLKNARNQIKALQDSKYAAREKIGRSTFGDATDLEKELLDKSITLERHKPFTTSVRKEIDDRINTIGQLIQGKKLNLMDAVEQEHAINDLLYNREFDKPARKYLSDLKGSLREFINKHGSKDFLKDHREANNLWLALNGKDLISKTIESTTDINKLLTHPMSKALLGGVSLTGAYFNPEFLAKTIGGLGIAYGTRGIYRVLSAMAKDPHARELYSKILLDAASGKLAIASKDAVKHVEQFDKFVSNKADKFKIKKEKRFRRITA